MRVPLHLHVLFMKGGFMKNSFTMVYVLAVVFFLGVGLSCLTGCEPMPANDKQVLQSEALKSAAKSIAYFGLKDKPNERKIAAQYASDALTILNNSTSDILWKHWELFLDKFYNIEMKMISKPLLDLLRTYLVNISTSQTKKLTLFEKLLLVKFFEGIKEGAEFKE